MTKSLPVRFEEEPTYSEFLESCLIPNVPALLPASAIQTWGARRKWACATSSYGGLHPAFQTLKDDFGEAKAPVVVQSIDQDSERETCEEISVKEAIRLMETSKEGQAESESSIHYLKDWHLFLQLESAGHSVADLYTPPKVFQDDWLNNGRLIGSQSEAANGEKRKRDDFRFCYAGQAATQTHLHADVYTSYSWSTNVVGRKRWRMFPPTVALNLRRFPPKDDSLEEVQRARRTPLARTVDEVDKLLASGRHANKHEWSRWKEARAEMIEFIQKEGETIFVPSNWYHEVLNLDDCISINHNWCNSVNLPSMYEAMKDEVEDVEHSLEDVKQAMREQSVDESWQAEWVRTVQNVVKSDMGWAWKEFWEMVQVNLEYPPCPVDLRPNFADFVAHRIRVIVKDFQKREECPLLDTAVIESVKRCEKFLDIAS